MRYFLEEIKRTAKEKIVYTEHSIDEMNAEEEITNKKRPVHIVCSPKKSYLGIITAYVPVLDKWMEDFRIRRKSK